MTKLKNDIVRFDLSGIMTTLSELCNSAIKTIVLLNLWNWMENSSQKLQKQQDTSKYTKVIFICVSFLFSINTIGLGQEKMNLKPYNVQLNSPNAASLGVYGEIPISNYTGTPNINIPIYEIDLDGMKIPISMSYHASGIHVQQEASWVGLGWALNAGGQITKSIKDEEDHEVTFTPDRVIRGYYESKALFNKYIDESYTSPKLFDNLSFPFPLMPPAYVVSGLQEFIYSMLSSDTEPDLYSYNFCDFSGKMITGAEEYQPAGHTDKKGLLLSPKEHLDFFFNGAWIAKDAKGYKYYFRTNEITVTTSGTNYSRFPDNIFSSGLSAENHKNIVKYFDNTYSRQLTSAWLLDSIVSPNNNKVVFEYSKECIDSPINITEAANYLASVNKDQTLGGVYVESYLPAVLPSNNYTLSNATIIQTILKKITWNGGEIVFNTTDREDLIPHDTSKPQKLSGVKVYNQDKVPIKDFVLEHTYLGNASTTAPGYDLRLLLTKITEKNSMAAHSFTYNMGELPSKNSLNTDLWGYYNGDKGTANAQYQDSKYKLYTIPSAKIKDITGRYITIYGANKNVDSLSMQHGMLESITYPTGGKTTFEFEPHRVSDTYVVEMNPGGKLNYDYAVVAEMANNSSIQTQTEVYCPFELSEDYSGATINSNHWPNDVAASADFDLYETYLKFRIQKLENGVYVDIPFRRYANSNYMSSYNIDLFPNGGTDNFDIDISLTAGKYRFVVSNDQYLSDNYFFYVGMSLYMKIATANNEVKSNMIGGTRIKRITNKIGNKEEVIDYKYLLSDGSKSSGVLMSTPFFNAKVTQRFEARYGALTDYRYERTYERFSTNPFLEQAYSAQGSHVGYDNVQVSRPGQGGYVNYSYNNTPGGAQQFNGVRLPILESPGNGLLKEVKYYNANLEPIKTEAYTYSCLESKKYYALAKDLEEIIDRGFWDPIDARNTVVCYTIPSSIIRLKDKKTTEYFTGNKSVVNSMSNEYDNTYFLPVSTQTTNSQGKSIKSMVKYPFNYSDVINKGMVEKNLLGIPVEEISLIDDNVTAANKTIYTDTLGMYLPSKIYTLNSTSPLGMNSYEAKYAEKARMSDYNKKGKLGFVWKNDNINTVYLWGYNYQYPVAKIDGLTYSQVVSELGQTFIDNLAASTSPDKNTLDVIRTKLSGRMALVSTYTYKPLIGIASVTDARGVTTNYTYDTFNRLLNVKNDDANILNEYKYHYYNQ